MNREISFAGCDRAEAERRLMARFGQILADRLCQLETRLLLDDDAVDVDQLDDVLAEMAAEQSAALARVLSTFNACVDRQAERAK